MTATNFTTTILVDRSPKEAFNAITNVRGWWSEEVQGGSAKLNDEFDYHFEDIHRCHVKLTEVIPNQKVVWHIVENYFKFTQDTTEWTGTKIIFELTEKDNKTQIRFTHDGLTTEYECFNICSNAWTQYIQHSLYNLITTGKGNPNATGKPTTADEKKFSSSNL